MCNRASFVKVLANFRLADFDHRVDFFRLRLAGRIDRLDQHATFVWADSKAAVAARKRFPSPGHVVGVTRRALARCCYVAPFMAGATECDSTGRIVFL